MKPVAILVFLLHRCNLPARYYSNQEVTPSCLRSINLRVQDFRPDQRMVSCKTLTTGYQTLFFPWATQNRDPGIVSMAERCRCVQIFVQTPSPTAQQPRVEASTDCTSRYCTIYQFYEKFERIQTFRTSSGPSGLVTSPPVDTQCAS